MPAALTTLLSVPSAFFVHAGHGETGFIAGVLHPLVGFDHLLAMLAVGFLGVRCAVSPSGSRNALWQVPMAFLSAMVVGGVLSWAGVPLPGVEWGIAVSVLVFGVAVALQSAPATWLACSVVGLFAVLHGHAHGAEMENSSVIAYFGGFLLATAVLHVSGAIVGWLLAQSMSQTSTRLAGAGVATASSFLFFGLMA